MPRAVDGRIRSATWRRLDAFHASSLGQSRWAVPFHPDDAAAVTVLVDDLRRVGADVQIGPIGSATDDPALSALADAAAARRWSRLHMRLDALASDPRMVSDAAGPGADPPVLEELLDLQQAYLANSQVDLSDQSERGRAADALRPLVTGLRRPDRGSSGSVLGAVHGIPADDPHLVVRHQVRMATRWVSEDGVAHQVLHLDPWPSIAWQLAFEEFETEVYHPDPTRPALDHATFRWEGSLDEGGAVFGRAQDRVRVFECSLRS